MRSLEMARRITEAPVEGAVRFACAGDSGAWADPTAEAVFAALVGQVAALDPPPAFFANLGDFAGPGTADRHERYLELVEPLRCPDVCVVGNHDLDDPSAPGVWERVHGPCSFDFACGHVRAVVLDATPGEAGEVRIEEPPEGVHGPDEEALAFLDERLAAAAEPDRVVLMHMPPFAGGRFAPHENWGFRPLEREFLAVLERHRVGLVCAAHGLGFDTWTHGATRFVMSGGGGTGLCSHLGGICTEGEGRPEDRGALFHAVELTVEPGGAVGGRVLQAFAPPGEARYSFGFSGSAGRPSG